MQQFLSLLFGAEAASRKAQASSSAPVSSSPASSSAAAPARDVMSNLKEELESRLNNDHSVEIRDTIEAIRASLAEAEARANGSSQSDSKGKGKAPAPASPVSDIAHSAEEVRSIEAAFRSLESEFVFPAQLDFTSRPSTPTSDTEPSFISRLSYNPHNQPLRFYHQGLSVLLSRLDSVESFGDEALRGRRKEVVGKVEGALDELEREVEGRWKKHQRSVHFEGPVVAQTPAEPAQVIPSSTDIVSSSEVVSDSTPAADALVASDSSPAEAPSNTDEAIVLVAAEVVQTSDAVEPTTSESSSEVVDDSSLSAEVLVDAQPTEAAAEHEPPVSLVQSSDTEAAVAESSVSTESSYPPVPTAYLPAPSADTDTAVSGYDVSPAIDTFLLPAQSSDINGRKKRPRVDDESDWSEIDA